MGRTHALSGAAAMLAAVPLLDRLAPELAPSGAGEIAAAAVVAAGAALLPDLDHDDSTVAEAFGPVTEVLSRIVRKLAGGHRAGTHSLVFTTAAGTAGYVAAQAGRWWAWAPMILLAGLALCAVGIRSTPIAVIIAAGYTATVVATGIDLAWLAPALALGVATHIAGDCLTSSGCQLFWPAPGRFHLGLFTTGGRVETLLVAPVLIAAIAVLTAHHAALWPFPTTEPPTAQP